MNKKLPKPQLQKTQETKHLRKENGKKQTNFIKKVLSLLKMMIIQKLSKFLKFSD